MYTLYIFRNNYAHEKTYYCLNKHIFMTISILVQYVNINDLTVVLTWLLIL